MTLGVLFAAACAFAEPVAQALTKPVLGPEAWLSSRAVVLAEVEKADAAAEAKWLAQKDEGEVRRYGDELRPQLIRAMGGFPERCALNARTTAMGKVDGYRWENVLFESWPGVHVTGNLYLPDEVRHKPPYPAVILSCGHSGGGKCAPAYARGGVLAAQAGIACLVYDPFGQGERTQGFETAADNPTAHNRIGALAILLGGGFPRFRVWDAVRALDYLESRPDVDRTRLGCMGNSGGGNVTAFLQAIDPRLKATAPSGYVCSFAYAAAHAKIGPGDACQNIFGQLPLGLNHASFCLMSVPLPIRVEAYHGDRVFPFAGTRHTVDLVAKVYARCGRADRFDMTDVEGEHAWYESCRVSSVDWMLRWLADRPEALGRAADDYRRLDAGFDLAKSDCGPQPPKALVCGGGGVLSLPGERTVFDVLRDELEMAEAKRSSRVTAERVRELAGIDLKRANALAVREVGRETTEGLEVVRSAYSSRDGLALPVVSFVPKEAKGAPVLILDYDARSNRTAFVHECLGAGRPAIVVDVIGTGEIGGNRRLHYGRPEREEELAVLLFALGQSLVGRQAEELIGIAADVKRRFGRVPDMIVRGRLAVAAAHARGASAETFGKVRVVDPPPSWTEAVRRSLYVPQSICVSGALCEYDWVDLQVLEQEVK